MPVADELGIDVVNAHCAGLDAARAGYRGIALGGGDSDILEPVMGSAHVLRERVVVVATVSGRGGSGCEQRQTARLLANETVFNFILPGINLIEKHDPRWKRAFASGGRVVAGR